MGDARVWTDDLRDVVRGMVRAPLFTLLIVSTLGVTIGANTAIFGVAEAVLFDPVHARRPQDLVFLTFPSNTPNATPGLGSVVTFTHRTFEELRVRSPVMSDLGAFDPPARFAASYGTGRAELAQGQFVSSSFFSVLGVDPLLGRWFSPADESRAERHVVVGHRYWQDRLGGEPAIIGSLLTVNRLPMTVIGVMPPEFTGVARDTAPDLFLPLALMPSMTPVPDLDAFRVRIVGRVDSGVSIDQAAAQLETALHGILMDELDGESAAVPERRERIQAIRLVLLPAAGGMSDRRDALSDPLAAMAIVAGLTLSIACVNVATLTMGRGMQRRRELAMRLALGARRGTLARQIVLHGVALGVCGGLAGGFAAYWSVRAMAPLPVFGNDPVDLALALDARVFWFVAVLSVGTGIVSSLAPWFVSAQVSPVEQLAAGGAGPRPGVFVRHALVAAQVATSFILLVAAGLFIRSLQETARVDLGIETEGVLLASVDPAVADRRDAAATGFFRDVRQRLNDLPGVRVASMAAAGPMGPTRTITMVSFPDGPDESEQVSVNWVGPRYFEALGIPIREGRDITESDSGESARVAVVNRLFADRFFPDRSPVGRPVDLNLVLRPGWTLTVVGVVDNSKYSRITEPVKPTIYVPALQDAALGLMTFVMRADGVDAASLAPRVRSEIRNLDPYIPVFDVQTLTDRIEDLLARERLTAWLSGFFGIIGLCLACLGIYGSQSYAVGARRSEIAVRIALGEHPRRVFGRVVLAAMTVAGAGIVLGAIGAAVFGRLISSLVYGVSPTDPATIAAAIAVVLLVAFCSAWPAARRASRVPATTLLRDS